MNRRFISPSLPPHTFIPISHNAKCALEPALNPLKQSIVMDSLSDCNAMHTNDQDRTTLAESSRTTEEGQTVAALIRTGQWMWAWG